MEIYNLEKFANEWAEENNIKYIPKKVEKKNEKVAVIGSGPAGIACSVELAKNGYIVTIFEKEEKPGGLLEYGIPDFRLKKDALTKLIKKLEDLGIKIECDKEFGNNLKFEDLKEYKAIFLGMGAAVPSTYKLTDKTCNNIYNAGDFLKAYNRNEKIENLGKVIVIGGGNVATDSARSAARMGAEKVTIVYRRNEELMPARKIERKDAIKDGVEIVYNTKVIKAKTNGDKIESVICKKTKIEGTKAVDIENSEFEIKTDTVIFAIGFGIEEEILKNKGIEMENGLVKVDEHGKTSIDRIYAGGDLVERKSTVARAIASGKTAAKGIIFS